jgi:hypothetical protein
MNSFGSEFMPQQQMPVTTEQARLEAEQIEAALYPDLDEVVRSHAEKVEANDRAEWYYRKFGKIIFRDDTVDETVLVFDGTNVLELWSTRQAA